MLLQNLTLPLFVAVILLTCVECQKKKSSSKLKQMMEEKVVADKAFEEELAKTRLEKEEREANKSKPGFFIGRIAPEIFEYTKLNQANWMSPNEAVTLCEDDLKCAGFTFRGSRDALNLPARVYFVHHFPKNLLEEPKGYSANWVSYRTKRPVVVLIGQPLIDREIIECVEDVANIKFKERIRLMDPKRMNHLKWPFPVGTAALTFYPKNDEVFRVNGMYALSEHNDLDKDYVTVLNSHEPEGASRIWDGRAMDMEICCPEVPNPLNINWFYDQDLDETIETISCDKFDKLQFEQKYVRQRIPVKIVGCFEESKVRGWSVQNMIDNFSKSEIKFEGSFLSTENNETYLMSNVNNEGVTKMFDNKVMFDLHAPVPQDLIKDFIADSSPVPEDVLIKAGKERNQPQIRIQSASTGSALTSESLFHCSTTTLLAGSRWWIILPRDSVINMKKFKCSKGSCSHKTTWGGSILGARAWFSHVFAQVIRRPFYGTKPVQTVQKPGEIIYVPGTSPYAFYNVDETVVDIHDTFFGVGNLEILSSIPDLENLTEKVLGRVASVEDRKRILGNAKQIKEHRVTKGGMTFNEDMMS